MLGREKNPNREFLNTATAQSIASAVSAAMINRRSAYPQKLLIYPRDKIIMGCY
jgi:hypothetical protein